MAGNCGLWGVGLHNAASAVLKADKARHGLLVVGAVPRLSLWILFACECIATASELGQADEATPSCALPLLNVADQPAPHAVDTVTILTALN